MIFFRSDRQNLFAGVSIWQPYKLVDGDGKGGYGGVHSLKKESYSCYIKYRTFNFYLSQVCDILFRKVCEVRTIIRFS